MTVKRMKIEDFESVKRFESSFDPYLAVLPPGTGDTVAKALGVVLKSSVLAEGVIHAHDGTLIEVEIEISKRVFQITAKGRSGIKVEDGNGSACDSFYEMIRQNSEEERLSRFVFDRKDRFSDRFMKYKDVEKYYPEPLFSELTNGIGKTRLFRSCLDGVIRECNRDCPEKVGGRRIAIKEDGKTSFDRDVLSQSDAVLFEYMCFIALNRLWRNVEAVRDLNHASLPLFLFDLDRTDGAVDRAALLKPALALERQVFVCGEPETEFVL